MSSRAFKASIDTVSILFHLVGVKFLAFERTMQGRGLMVRTCRLREIPLLVSLFEADIHMQASGLRPGSNSLLSFVKWVKRVFSVLYVIEIREVDQSRIVGFIGIYRMKMGESLCLAIAIFKPLDRRRGYGEEALRLVVDSLRRKRVAKSVYAEVGTANQVSLGFFKKSGFEICEKAGGQFLLMKSIK